MNGLQTERDGGSIHSESFLVPVGDAADESSISGQSTETDRYGIQDEMDQTVQHDRNADAVVIAEQSESASYGYVYVCGAVKVPGVYPVTEDMRLFEAVEAAGGFAADADEQWLNQALPVTDGQRIYVYTRAETLELGQDGAEMEDRSGMSGTVGTDSAAAGLQSGDAQDKVNLNTASREELMTLPGIGSAKADAILQYRMDYGGFDSIEEIMQISGIKDAVFSKIKEVITV